MGQQGRCYAVIICVLACNVWERAYDLDYQNRRPDYVSAWLGKLVNWDFASRQLAETQL